MDSNLGGKERKGAGLPSNPSRPLYKEGQGRGAAHPGAASPSCLAAPPLLLNPKP